MRAPASLFPSLIRLICLVCQLLLVCSCEAVDLSIVVTGFFVSISYYIPFLDSQRKEDCASWV
jgi:hypothetical protein